jgi:hypothetical protein
LPVFVFFSVEGVDIILEKQLAYVQLLLYVLLVEVALPITLIDIE